MKHRYFYGYNIVAAGFVTQLVCIGAMFTYGVFFKELQTAFGWSRAMISGASSMAFLMMGCFGVLAGSLNDRIGPRIVLTVSGISLGIGYLLMSQLQTPWQLYLLYGLLVGIGFATHDVITLSTVARWFVKRRGTMTGLTKVGTGAGQLLVPLIASSLIAAFGWRQTYLIIGTAAMVMLLAAAQWMRRDPQLMDLLPDGESLEQQSLEDVKTAPDLPFEAIVRTRSFWCLCLAGFAGFYAIFTVIVHIVPHGQDVGLSSVMAAGVLSTIGGISMLGRIIMGTASDHIGCKRALMICFGLMTGSLVLLLTAKGTWMLYTFALFYGFAHGSLFTLLSPTVADLFGTGSHGLVFGLVLFSSTLGGSIGPLLAGHLFDSTGTYGIAFTAATAMAFLSLLLVLILRPVKRADEAR